MRGELSASELWGIAERWLTGAALQIDSLDTVTSDDAFLVHSVRRQVPDITALNPCLQPCAESWRIARLKAVNHQILPPSEMFAHSGVRCVVTRFAAEELEHEVAAAAWLITTVRGRLHVIVGDPFETRRALLSWWRVCPGYIGSERALRLYTQPVAASSAYATKRRIVEEMLIIRARREIERFPHALCVFIDSFFDILERSTFDVPVPLTTREGAVGTEDLTLTFPAQPVLAVEHLA